MNKSLTKCKICLVGYDVNISHCPRAELDFSFFFFGGWGGAKLGWDCMREPPLYFAKFFFEYKKFGAVRNPPPPPQKFIYK